MMHVSKQVDYALQLITALSRLKEGEFLSLRAFSQESNISFLFLQRIARILKNTHIIDANRGVYGGYYLMVDPYKITFKQLVEAVEGSFGITTCIRNNPKKCPHASYCTGKKTMASLNKSISSILEQTYILQQ
ncbi:MAG TPA: hypothetical protein DCS29_00085 [Candidatus Magasanikbacteria bacterium]|nr:MAG: hypothetical protein A2479_02185 [Candidatus Magasanikbacteria bacterium RIFOXYC2_FULL_39_8]HAT03163.1 hypothetical protein [Candidatus Magasanikbacteria bacterium]